MNKHIEAKMRENRLRAAAKRQGLELHKSRVRDKRAIGYGVWIIFDPDGIVDETAHLGDLDDIERYLTGDE